MRLRKLTDVTGDPDGVPRDAFAQTAATKLLAGGTPYEEVVETRGKCTLRGATSTPVVSENYVVRHANFLGIKGNIGALAYPVPVID